MINFNSKKPSQFFIAILKTLLSHSLGLKVDYNVMVI